MIDVLGAVTGEGHNDHPVYLIDRGIAQIKLLVSHAQSPELAQDGQCILAVDQWPQMIDAAIAELIENPTRYLNATSANQQASWLAG